MTKKTLGVSKSDNTHWPSLRRLTTVKPPLSGVCYDFIRIWQLRNYVIKALSFMMAGTSYVFLLGMLLLSGVF